MFHAAALCDYRVEQVLSGAGKAITSAKFATRDGRLHLILAPAMKVLPRMRGWFPGARIVGWKYELAGTRDDAFGKAWNQLRDCETDACVLNGAAYGEGFALCHADWRVQTCSDAPALCEDILEWLLRPVPTPADSKLLQPAGRISVRFFCSLRPTHSQRLSGFKAGRRLVNTKNLEKHDIT